MSPLRARVGAVKPGTWRAVATQPGVRRDPQRRSLLLRLGAWLRRAPAR